MKDLLIRENHYFKSLQPKYNISKDPSSPMLGRTHSDISKEKMRGRTYSKKIRERMSASSPYCQQIEVLDFETGISKIYKSMNAAARALNINQSIISLYFQRNQIKPYKGRYVFRILQKK